MIGQARCDAACRPTMKPTCGTISDDTRIARLPHLKTSHPGFAWCSFEIARQGFLLFLGVISLHLVKIFQIFGIEKYQKEPWLFQAIFIHSTSQLALCIDEAQGSVAFTSSSLDRDHENSQKLAGWANHHLRTVHNSILRAYSRYQKYFPMFP